MSLMIMSCAYLQVCKSPLLFFSFKQMTSNVDGHSWALCAIEETKVPKIVTPLNRDFIPLTDPPVVVQQHNVPPQKFVLLSAQVQKK